VRKLWEARILHFLWFINRVNISARWLSGYVDRRKETLVKINPDYWCEIKIVTIIERQQSTTTSNTMRPSKRASLIQRLRSLNLCKSYPPSTNDYDINTYISRIFDSKYRHTASLGGPLFQALPTFYKYRSHCQSRWKFRIEKLMTAFYTQCAQGWNYGYVYGRISRIKPVTGFHSYETDGFTAYNCYLLQSFPTIDGRWFNVNFWLASLANTPNLFIFLMGSWTFSL